MTGRTIRVIGRGDAPHSGLFEFFLMRDVLTSRQTL
jgi:hypothetical protein